MAENTKSFRVLLENPIETDSLKDKTSDSGKYAGKICYINFKDAYKEIIKKYNLENFSEIIPDEDSKILYIAGSRPSEIGNSAIYMNLLYNFFLKHGKSALPVAEDVEYGDEELY